MIARHDAVRYKGPSDAISGLWAGLQILRHADFIWRGVHLPGRSGEVCMFLKPRNDGTHTTSSEDPEG